MSARATSERPDLAERIDWLYDLQHFGMKLGLDNITALLDVLGRPERAFRTIVVAGTNGKGSVAAMIESMLRAQGMSTGLFTSPHLVALHERIRIDGEEIDDDALSAALARLRATVEGELDCAPSFFEAITATALCEFRRRGVDVAVLEVGLGGRLDATNAVDADLAVITQIALDHMKTLGPTIALIAREKAGIIKPGKRVVHGVSRQRAIDVIAERAHQLDATLIDARERVRGPLPQCGLPGRHQIENARIAVAAALEFTDGALSTDAIERGLASVRWRGRLEWLRSPDGAEVLLDAAHNPDGVEALVVYLERLGRKPATILFGTTTGKEPSTMLDPLAGLAERIVLTRPDVRRGVEPEQLLDAARRAFDTVEIVRAHESAVELALRRTPRDAFLLVTGSLYLVGQAIARLEPRGRTARPISM